MLDLLIVVFASWYLAYSVTSTHGPFAAFEWLREHVPHGRKYYSDGATVSSKGEWSNIDKKILRTGLLDCPVCLAPWVALVLLIAPMGVVTQALGVAGAAMILHGWSGWRFAQ